MRLFPWFTEKFHSSFSQADLLQQMRSNVEQSSSWRGLANGQPSYSFRGQIGSNSFTIARIPQGRGSMQPVIEGRVSADYAGGSQLQLRYRLSWPTCIFAGIWLSAAGLWLLAELCLPIGGGLFGAFAMFGFGLLLFTLPFWLEVTESRQLLTYLLKLEPISVALRN
jgi:hypothetical protein